MKTKTLLSIRLPLETINKIRDFAFWIPGLTVTDIIEAGVSHQIHQLERKHGSVEPRTGKLPRGRRAA